MAIPHAKSGEVIDIRPLGSALAQARTTTLVKTKALEIIHLVIPSGKRSQGIRPMGKSRSSAWKVESPSRQQ